MKNSTLLAVGGFMLVTGSASAQSGPSQTGINDISLLLRPGSDITAIVRDGTALAANVTFRNINDVSGTTASFVIEGFLDGVSVGVFPSEASNLPEGQDGFRFVSFDNTPFDTLRISDGEGDVGAIVDVGFSDVVTVGGDDELLLEPGGTVTALSPFGIATAAFVDFSDVVDASGSTASFRIVGLRDGNIVGVVPENLSNINEPGAFRFYAFNGELFDTLTIADDEGDVSATINVNFSTE